MRLLHLPASLLLLVAAQISAQADDRPPPQLPTAIRKMPPDDGEKFFPHYAAFAPPQQQQFFLSGRSFDAAGPLEPPAVNVSAYKPPFAAHDRWEEAYYTDRSGAVDVLRRAAAAVALSLLQRRQWGCPTGTTSCAGIGFQFSCCRTDETCYRVQDTGLGPVGCCPAGKTCGGSLSGCGDGRTGCPSNLGGGCCITGFACRGVGCVQLPPPGSATTFTTTSTSIAPAPSPSTIIVTVIVTISNTKGGPTTTTTTSTSTPSPPPPPTDTPSGTDTGAPPLKPTLTDTSTPAGGGQTLPFCPTGYYACLASAGGGCCQTGRDCHTTSCPPPPASTTIVSDGRTVVVPATGLPGGGPSKTCAGGWFLCGATAGPIPGCCPSGYACGTASCTVVGLQGTATVAKELPSSARRSRNLDTSFAVRIVMMMMTTMMTPSACLIWS